MPRTSTLPFPSVAGPAGRCPAASALAARARCPRRPRARAVQRLCPALSRRARRQQPPDALTRRPPIPPPLAATAATSPGRDARGRSPMDSSSPL
eukprot:5345885-Prymnesium_polylepis.2